MVLYASPSVFIKGFVKTYEYFPSKGYLLMNTSIISRLPFGSTIPPPTLIRFLGMTDPETGYSIFIIGGTSYFVVPAED